MRIVLENDCMDGEFRTGDEITIDPTMGISADDFIVIMHDDGLVDIGKVIVSPQSEFPLLETGGGRIHQTTDIEIAGKVIKLERTY